MKSYFSKLVLSALILGNAHLAMAQVTLDQAQAVKDTYKDLQITTKSGQQIVSGYGIGGCGSDTNLYFRVYVLDSEVSRMENFFSKEINGVPVCIVPVANIVGQ